MKMKKEESERTCLIDEDAHECGKAFFRVSLSALNALQSPTNMIADSKDVRSVV